MKPTRPNRSRPAAQAGRAGWVSACLLLLLACWPLAAAQIDEQQAKLEQLRQRIARLTEDLHLDRNRLDSYQNELREIERNISQHKFTLKDLEGSLQRRQRLLERLEPREQQQLQRLQRHQRLLAQQLRAAWLMGEQNRLKMLLNQQDPSRIARLLKYHEYLNRARSRKMQQLRGLLQELEQTRRSLDEERQRMAELRGQALQRQQQLERDKAQRAALLEKLAAEIQDKDKQLNNLKRNEANLKQLVSQLQQTLQELAVQQSQKTPFGDHKGRMSWPVKGRLGARFGSPRAGGIRWDGVFLRASEGSQVAAIQPGRVAFADWLRGYGLLLIIDHGEGYMSLYGHNQSLFKKVGETVTQGETLAQSGSASLHGQGIYFGIRHNGKPLDPAGWCR
ncbi:MAG: peptidoglycan DD-metalloendopeptidase family protein [Gammaproteobacteria bacterium SHHR-1]|uniref:murein hydrolase activator EnvC family protein n=1 Tax=Magnetovirga frankeli TaxID=947516 RepID=UPI0012935B88|nr:peptidoglycan DD-metalloendopeptidase family protein [gamma proteobacterium SS-5]